MRMLLVIIFSLGLPLSMAQAGDLPTAADLAKMTKAVNTTYGALNAAQETMTEVNAKNKQLLDDHFLKEQGLKDLKKSVAGYQKTLEEDQSANEEDKKTIAGVIASRQAKIAEIEAEIAEMKPAVDEAEAENFAELKNLNKARAAYNEAVSAHANLVLQIAMAAIERADSTQEVINEMQILQDRIDAFCSANPTVSLCTATSAN